MDLLSLRCQPDSHVMSHVSWMSHGRKLVWIAEELGKRVCGNYKAIEINELGVTVVILIV